MTDEAEPPSEPADQDYAFILRPEKSPYWSTRGLKLDLGADRWARVIGSRMLKHIRHSIQLGLSPAGGGQKPLKEGTGRDKKADRGKRPKARGFTEHAIFVRSLALRKVASTKRKANYLITTDMPEVFGEWLVDEKSRGVDYFPITGDMARLVEKTLDDLIRRAPRTGKR